MNSVRQAPAMPFYIFLTFFMMIALSACSEQSDEDDKQTPRPAKLYTVGKMSQQISDSYPAVVRSIRSTDLAFQVSGQITGLNALGGQHYRKGQVIAWLDPRNYRNSVNQAEAQFENANSDYQRALRLIKENAISQSVVEARHAQVKIAQASLDSARKNLADTVLRAPFTGEIGRTYVEQYQNVQAQAPIVNLQSSAVEAIVNIPSRLVLYSERVRFYDAFVELDDAPGRRYPAEFREATGQADSSTQTYEGRFTFDPPDDLVVLTGMSATLSFQYELENVEGINISEIEIPFNAVIAQEDRHYVWIVNDNDYSVSRREITILDRVGELVYVKSGLKSDDIIIAAGGAYLKEGDHIRPISL